MASLKDEIKNDLNKSLKQENGLSRSILSLLLSSILSKEKEKKYEESKKEKNLSEKEKSILTNEEIGNIIISLIKKNKEAVSKFKEGGRDDLAEKEEKEIEILKKYLPDGFSIEELSEEKLGEIISKTIKENNFQGMKDMGKAMTIIMAKVRGRADGSLVSKLTKNILLKR